jgi:hypothetical protein
MAKPGWNPGLTRTRPLLLCGVDSIRDRVSMER